MTEVQKAVYLGDVFNSRGDNNDLIQDRVIRGTRCLVSVMSECNVITRGCLELLVLILMYRSLFIPTVLYNCEAWNNLTQEQLKELQTIQLKFLKRALHVPRSTPNALVLLELGILPIENEIHLRQLRFLHHVLTLDPHDPVKEAFEQQKLFKFERNWANEIHSLMKEYSIEVSEQEISNMSLDKWKSLIKKKITHAAIIKLNEQRQSLSKGSTIPPYKSLCQQGYLSAMLSEDARTMFQIRSQICNTKECRKYMYEEAGSECRICKTSQEDIDHVLNKCEKVMDGNSLSEVNVYSLEQDELNEVVRRFKRFKELVKEVNSEHT